MKILQKTLIALVLAVATPASARSEAKPAGPPSVSTAVPSEINGGWMVEGEKRYRTNCGRCHQPPHKLAPREMSMAVRHMRVRALLTDDDMRYILYYVTH